MNKERKTPDRPIALRVDPEIYDLLKDIAETDEKSLSQIARQAIRRYITARAVEDDHFADKVRMAKERMWAREMKKSFECLGIEPRFEDITKTAESLDLNIMRTADLLGIEPPEDVMVQ